MAFTISGPRKSNAPKWDTISQIIRSLGVAPMVKANLRTALDKLTLDQCKRIEDILLERERS